MVTVSTADAKAASMLSALHLCPSNLIPRDLQPSLSSPPLLVFSCRTFTWRNAAIGYMVYVIPGIFGITLCYHRMLTHRSFKTYK